MPRPRVSNLAKALDGGVLVGLPVLSAVSLRGGEEHVVVAQAQHRVLGVTVQVECDNGASKL
jgi:hypothetical protein